MLRLRLPKILVALLAALAAAAVGAAGARACGRDGYSYAGLASPSRAFGVSATVTPLGSFSVVSGHVAGWVGVGGPGLGPSGTDEWLQVGFSGFPQVAGNDLYYELKLPHAAPSYHQLAAHVPFGASVQLAVLEMRARPDHWRVWLNGKPASRPIAMPGSHARWAPVVTAEAWDGGTGRCNAFLYRFRRISLARAPGGGWHPLAGGVPITSASTRIHRSTRSASFLAAQGPEALRSLASLRP